MNLGEYAFASAAVSPSSTATLREALRGNQLAVFPDGRGLSDRTMQAIAREMNLSESTFVLPAERTDTDVRMRIFTPARELPIAGHPTIGSTFALAESGAITKQATRFVFGLGVGPTAVDLEWADGHLRFAWMTQPNPEFGPPLEARATIAAAIGLGVDDLADHPVQRVSCGVPYVLVPLRDRAAVDRAVPDAAAFRRAAPDVGEEFAAFAFAIIGDGMLYSRMFAPVFGITEDPATGSACGPVGCYLVRHALVSSGGQGAIVNDQGVAMGRASRIHIAVRGDARAITEVKVGGEAVLVGRGELLV